MNTTKNASARTFRNIRDLGHAAMDYATTSFYERAILKAWGIGSQADVARVVAKHTGQTAERFNEVLAELKGYVGRDLIADVLGGTLVRIAHRAIRREVSDLQREAEDMLGFGLSNGTDSGMVVAFYRPDDVLARRGVNWFSAVAFGHESARLGAGPARAFAR